MRGLVWSLLIVALVSSPVLAGDFPWDRVPGVDITAYKADFISQVESRLRQLKSYGRCKYSISDCLRTTPAHKTAIRLARDVLILMADGSSNGEVEEWIKTRHKMAHPAIEDVRHIALNGISGLGKTDAPVVVVEYSDFQCPFCARVNPMLEKVESEMRGKVRLYFKQFPIKSHPRALEAAKACVAAGNQGKFWDYCPKLFEIRLELTDENILKLARECGLEIDKFKVDMKSDAVLNRIADEKMEGLKNRVMATPAIFINGKEFLLKPTQRLLIDRIEEELDIIHGVD